MFIDFHSHILHSIDDGPESMEKSVELLNSAIENGAHSIITTPHFYPDRHGLTEQLETAKTRFSELKNYVLDNNIQVDILLGYEVRYFEGISRIEELDELCINGSKVLLLELGAINITEKTVEELLDLSYSGYTILLAHIERYTKLPGFKNIKRLIASGEVLAQCNAASFVSGSLQRVAFKLLKENLVYVIASDAHSIDLRPPYLKEAYEIIEKKFGLLKKKLLLKRAEELFGLCQGH